MTPAEVLAAAGQFVGVPYKEHGDTPAGWDCRGCVRHLRREIFGLESPGMDPAEYTVRDVKDLDLVADLMAARRGLWRELARFEDEPPAERVRQVGTLRPGAVILFSVFGRDAHVGVLLTRRDFAHTLAGQETTILRLDGDRWSSRIRGAYDTSRDDP